MRKRTGAVRIAAAAAGVAGLTLLGAGPAFAQDVQTAPGAAVSGNAFGGNAGYQQTVITNTEPANGTVTVSPFGDYTYTPNAGFVGTDSFQVTSSDAVKLFTTDLPPLGSFDGVNVTGSGYGSSVVAVPGQPGFIYGLTDRGPNVNGTGSEKVEPIPDFDPAIGKFQLVDGKANLIQSIPLKNIDGAPLNGQVNTAATTGETIVDLDGNPLPATPNGFDSEGLVAMPDGTFYVSDEYGPFIWHFDADGVRINDSHNYSPYDAPATLPEELKNRNPNQGMEGLTITPDGTTLVGLMQSSLVQGGLTTSSAKKSPLTRLVTINLATGETHEYIYLLHDPAATTDASSEITAISNTQFIVDERDGNLPPATNRKLYYTIDISGATDVGPNSTFANGHYVGANGGLLLDDQPMPNETLEQYIGVPADPGSTETAQSMLETEGITPVQTSANPTLDLSKVLNQGPNALDPTGAFFGHDKTEGVYPVTPDGSILMISNDSDFGIVGTTPGGIAPHAYTLVPKILADGTQDQGAYLEVDTTKLNDPKVTTTVTITVAPPASPTPTTSSPSPTTTAPAAATSSAAAAGPSLANTGARVGGWIAIGLALLVLGVGAMLLSRRGGARR
jgi:hypothetical protein